MRNCVILNMITLPLIVIVFLDLLLPLLIVAVIIPRLQLGVFVIADMMKAIWMFPIPKRVVYVVQVIVDTKRNRNEKQRHVFHILYASKCETIYLTDYCSYI